MIAQAQSGTGKTATFSIGLLQRIDLRDRRCQAIVLAPTRDLALQIEREVRSIGHYLGVSTIAAIGGTRTREMGDTLRAGVQLVVGTPGRIKDMIERRHLQCDAVRMLVLDEADDLLSLGFRDQIYEIFRLLPPHAKVGLFSATLPAEVLELTARFMADDAVRILVKRELQTLDGIRQYYVDVHEEQHKFECLCELYSELSITQAIIPLPPRALHPSLHLLAPVLVPSLTSSHRPPLTSCSAAHLSSRVLSRGSRRR